MGALLVAVGFTRREPVQRRRAAALAKRSARPEHLACGQPIEATPPATRVQGLDFHLECAGGYRRPGDADRRAVGK